MYNPTPVSKLAGNGVPRGVSSWKPLQPLRPIELQNAGFVQENYLRKKANTFALWTVEEQQAANKLAEEALAMVPCLDPAQLAGALYDGQGQDMDVHALHQGFLKGAQAKGVKLP